jgi:hypothetical protein
LKNQLADYPTLAIREAAYEDYLSVHAETSPYYVLQVEKTRDLRGNLTFVLLDGGEKVARQEAVIP